MFGTAVVGPEDFVCEVSGLRLEEGATISFEPSLQAHLWKTRKVADHIAHEDGRAGIAIRRQNGSGSL